MIDPVRSAKALVEFGECGRPIQHDHEAALKEVDANRIRWRWDYDPWCIWLVVEAAFYLVLDLTELDLATPIGSSWAGSVEQIDILLTKYVEESLTESGHRRLRNQNYRWQKRAWSVFGSLDLVALGVDDGGVVEQPALQSDDQSFKISLLSRFVVKIDSESLRDYSVDVEGYASHSNVSQNVWFLELLLEALDA